MIQSVHIVFPQLQKLAFWPFGLDASCENITLTYYYVARLGQDLTTIHDHVSRFGQYGILILLFRANN